MSAGAWRRVSWLDGSLPVRLAIVLDVAGWSGVLAEPDNTFDRGHQYALMAQWADEMQWAALFGIGAVGMLACSAIRSRFLRAAVAGYACVLQTAIAVSFAASPTPSTGTLTHVGIALLGAWLVWRELVR